MKLKLSVFVGVVLCLVLMGLYGVLSRMFDSRDGWRPNDVYSLVGGSSYSTVSYSSSHSGGLAVPAMSMRGGRSFSRRAVAPAFSYAPVSAPTYSQSPIGGTPSNSVASPIYTTSSATMKSFGGGNISSSVFAGAANSASPASSAAPIVAGVGMPSVNMPVAAYGNTRLNTNDLSALMSGDVALSTASAYAGIGNTTAGGPMGVRGRRNVGVQDTWLGWLGSDMWGYGGGSNQITQSDLFKLWFKGMTGEEYDPSNPDHTAQYNDFMNSGLWESFLAWFNGKQSDETFGWYWAPLSDAIPFVLLLSLLYAWFIYRKTKKQTI